jgi:hypothetical protein
MRNLNKIFIEISQIKTNSRFKKHCAGGTFNLINDNKYVTKIFNEYKDTVKKSSL